MNGLKLINHRSVGTPPFQRINSTQTREPESSSDPVISETNEVLDVAQAFLTGPIHDLDFMYRKESATEGSEEWTEGGESMLEPDESIYGARPPKSSYIHGPSTDASEANIDEDAESHHQSLRPEPMDQLPIEGQIDQGQNEALESAFFDEQFEDGQS